MPQRTTADDGRSQRVKINAQIRHDEKQTPTGHSDGSGQVPEKHLSANGSGEGSFPSTDEPAMAKPSSPTLGPEVTNPEMKDNDASDDDAMHEDGNDPEDHTMNLGSIDSLERTFHDQVCEIVLAQLGASSQSIGKSYGREKRRATRKLISDIYSLPWLLQISMGIQ